MNILVLPPHLVLDSSAYPRTYLLTPPIGLSGLPHCIFHMAASDNRRKRKASPPNPKPDESFGDGNFEGVLSQDDDSDFEGLNSDGGSDVEGLVSDDEGHFSDASADRSDILPNGADGDEPNYRVVTDANGGSRYEYPEVDPVYDSDDSDAAEEANTIGNIPLSFYDSYPHIGYNLDGKKIMRPAAGGALDALLDAVEVPNDWTGLTDPATGLPLKISQDELEIIRKVQMNEITEDGYDPYPVGNPMFCVLTSVG